MGDVDDAADAPAAAAAVVVAAPTSTPNQRGVTAMKVIARIRGLTDWEEGESEVLSAVEGGNPNAVRPCVL
jgi:hypothetical protein